MDYEKFMKLAIKEAHRSYRDGGNGIGCVIVKDNKVIATGTDREVQDNDPTAHAVVVAIRNACKKIGRDLSGCTLLCTHDFCPVCASAIVWAGVTDVACGYLFQQLLFQKKLDINLSSGEIFAKAYNKITVHQGVLNEECSVLYREDVVSRVKMLRGADDWECARLNKKLTEDRIQWFRENRDHLPFLQGELIDQGYELLLELNNSVYKMIPVTHREKNKIIIHWGAFCPTLEACKILNLDTKRVCRRLLCGVNDTLFKVLDPRLSHGINYDVLRPRYPYCEEYISFDDTGEGAAE